ncbi:hypothetical protein [Nocardioides sp. Arc9.136]|uniref:hypothetical protein n=1 Tax=Nocardioides sp. Arc9.136 TaxID=2996826 RepID=UPI0026670AF9|nr:hypothetical protein [Nocardioides sp. Arc9.136]WKN49972.1 hypothetical protein OSR43_07575 [Nocardioides sp. Arc9.136]
MSTEHGVAGGPLPATEAWFLQHGLSYFVPEERHQAREALRPRRFLPAAVLTVLLALGGGVVLAWLSEELTAAPAFLLTIGVLGAAAYSLTALRTRPIVVWALRRGLGSLRTLLPMMSRALPLLLLFVTFLFINAEAWQLSASLSTGTLWLVVLLFGLLAVAFLLVRLPEEVDRTDDDVDDDFLLRACAGTPLEGECRALVDDPGADPAAYATVVGFERWNLVLVLVVIQAVQVLLLAATVLVFFLVFGGLVMDIGVQEAWTGAAEGSIRNLPYLDQVSVPLFQVSLFLAAFSNLYLTVSTVTDETYREQFFGSVLREMERAVGVRAVYLALRDRVSAGRVV